MVAPTPTGIAGSGYRCTPTEHDKPDPARSSATLDEGIAMVAQLLQPPVRPSTRIS